LGGGRFINATVGDGGDLNMPQQEMEAISICHSRRWRRSQYATAGAVALL